MEFEVYKNKGFSVVELLIGIAVVLVLFGVISSAFLRFRDTQALNSTSEQIISLLDESRLKTISSKNSSQHGVRFESDKIIRFEGEVFLESDSSNEELIISESVEIVNITLIGGGDDLVFQKLSGNTNQSGSLTIRSKKDNTKTKIINIEPSGAVSVENE
ncbi:Tfp pilus assembly protein FimT/FimU [Patescibacteria group bacterium]